MLVFLIANVGSPNLLQRLHAPETKPNATVRAEIHRAPRRGRKFFWPRPPFARGGQKLVSPPAQVRTRVRQFFPLSHGSAKPIGNLFSLTPGIAGGSFRFLLMCAGYAPRLSGLISLRSQTSGTLHLHKPCTAGRTRAH